MNSSIKQKIIENLVGHGSQHRQPAIGLEYERVTAFGHDLLHHKPITDKQQQLLQTAMSDFQKSHDNFTEYTEHGQWKGLKNQKTGYCITFEPGLQLELSSGVYTDLQPCLTDMSTLDHEVVSHLKKYDIHLLPEAVNPTVSLDHAYIMNYSRLHLLKNSVNKHNPHPTAENLFWMQSMMSLTTGLQLNLNHFGADDMMKRLQAMLLLQPLFMALFSNSAFLYKEYANNCSYRYLIWQKINQIFLTHGQKRCGIWDFLWHSKPSVEEYVDYVMRLPMLFFLRDGVWQDLPMHYTFYDLMQSKPMNGKIYTPTVQDWELHHSSTFPDVRARNGYLEIRFLDTHDWHTSQAIILWLFTIFYDDDLIDFIGSWPWEYGLNKDNYDEVINQVMLHGLASKMPNGVTMQQLARTLYDMFTTKIDSSKPLYKPLSKIEQIIASGRNPAQDKALTAQRDWAKYINLIDILEKKSSRL